MTLLRGARFASSHARSALALSRVMGTGFASCLKSPVGSGSVVVTGTYTMIGYSINSGISGLLQPLLSPESLHHAAELLARELLVPPAARVDQEAPVYVVP